MKIFSTNSKLHQIVAILSGRFPSIKF